MNRKLLAILVCILVYITLFSINNSISLAADNALQTKEYFIFLFTQKSIDGINIFDPFEEIKLCAKVLYKEVPVVNIPVTFQIGGPLFSDYPLNLVRSNRTDENGIARISFRTPVIDDEFFPKLFLGTYNASAYTEVNNRFLYDSTSFEIKWLVEVTRVETLDKNEEPQNNYTRNTSLLIKYILKNDATSDKEVNVLIQVFDSSKNKIIESKIDNIVVERKSSRVMSHKLKIPLQAELGQAEVNLSIYPAFYSLNNLTIGMHKKVDFLIINREVAIKNSELSANKVFCGEVVEITVTITNKGDKKEEVIVRFYENQRLIRKLESISLLPKEDNTLLQLWDTSDVKEGNYTLSVDVMSVPGEIELENNVQTINTIQIIYPSIFPHLFHCYIIVNTITGTLTFCFLTIILRRKSKLTRV